MTARLRARHFVVALIGALLTLTTSVGASSAGLPAGSTAARDATLTATPLAVNGTVTASKASTSRLVKTDPALLGRTDRARPGHDQARLRRNRVLRRWRWRACRRRARRSRQAARRVTRPSAGTGPRRRPEAAFVKESRPRFPRPRSARASARSMAASPPDPGQRRQGRPRRSTAPSRSRPTRSSSPPRTRARLPRRRPRLRTLGTTRTPARRDLRRPRHGHLARASVVRRPGQPVGPAGARTHGGRATSGQPADPGQRPFVCQNKLIGGEAFLDTYLSIRPARRPSHTSTARDSNGHGTHTTSTAAGNVARPTSSLRRRAWADPRHRPRRLGHRIQGLRHRGLLQLRLGRGGPGSHPRRRRCHQLLDLGRRAAVLRPGRAGLPRRLCGRRVRRRLGRQLGPGCRHG